MAQLSLNRVALDGVVVRRLSATLHFGTRNGGTTKDSPWWAYVACERIPRRYSVGARRMRLDATLVSGREIHADVTIAKRREDAYGTTLILSGIDPLPDDRPLNPCYRSRPGAAGRARRWGPRALAAYAAPSDLMVSLAGLRGSSGTGAARLAGGR